MIEDASASRVGLCATCTHVQRVISDHGAVFYLCTLSAVDPRFPKYPRLPVLSCAGYEKRSEESGAEIEVRTEFRSSAAPEGVAKKTVTEQGGRHGTVCKDRDYCRA